MNRVLPILFNGDMVRAILDGRKTVTRRLIKPQQLIGLLPDKCKNGTTEEFLKEKKYMFKPYCDMTDAELINASYNPPCQPGDILYVRETVWQKVGYYLDVDGETKPSWYNEFKYTATDEKPETGWNYSWATRPSIHMPKEAARIWLKVKDVRVERLQDITEEQVDAEGFRYKPPCLRMVSADGHYCDLDGPCTSSIKYCDMSMGELFGKELWNSTIKKSDLDRYGWDANPWVWVIEFERCENPDEITALQALE